MISPTTPRLRNGPVCPSPTFLGEAGNIKLTTAEDFVEALSARAVLLDDIRTGMGFDVHAFGDGDHVVLGGIRIAHDRGAERTFRRRRGAACAGRRHSRRARRRRYRFAFSALAIRNGAARLRTVSFRFAVERVKARGGMVAHLDTTIVCEAPKIGPHRDAMRARIARDRRHCHRPRRREGDDQRRARLHRPRRRHRRLCDRHDPAAEDAQRCWMTILSPPRKSCSISAGARS